MVMTPAAAMLRSTSIMSLPRDFVQYRYHPEPTAILTRVLGEMEVPDTVGISRTSPGSNTIMRSVSVRSLSGFAAT